MRYTGPTFRKARRYGTSILETGKEFAKGKRRTTAPGIHGATRRPKMSDYGTHLYEKQKVRFIYGINERQFRRFFEIAKKDKEVTGTSLLQTLELRFDNVVYRAGFAITRKQARQLVSHAHFIVNGKKANIPSMILKVGDAIELRESSQKSPQIVAALDAKPHSAWLNKVAPFKYEVSRKPERSEINPEINEALIVEFYSK